MFIPTEKVVRRTLLLLIAGTRGGIVRLRILLLLDRKPHNINELATVLGLDYKTIQHHMRVLEKAGLVKSSRKAYGNSYLVSDMLKAHKPVMSEIRNMGKSK